MTSATPYQRRVVCAACRDESLGRMVIGARHNDGIMHLYADDFSGWQDGFIDQHGTCMDRQEAWQVASAAGQIIRRCGGDDANGGTLYSENLY